MHIRVKQESDGPVGHGGVQTRLDAANWEGCRDEGVLISSTALVYSYIFRSHDYNKHLFLWKHAHNMKPCSQRSPKQASLPKRLREIRQRPVDQFILYLYGIFKPFVLYLYCIYHYKKNIVPGNFHFSYFFFLNKTNRPSQNEGWMNENCI